MNSCALSIIGIGGKRYIEKGMLPSSIFTRIEVHFFTAPMVIAK